MIFKGLSAFPITPADEEGHVDVKDLVALIRRLKNARVDSIGLLGSTGSYPYLSRDERRRAIEATIDEVSGAVPVIVGIGALRTSEVIRLGQDAKEAGADAALLAPVSYTPLTEEEVFVHYKTIASEVGLPICIYNNPTTTRFTFSADLIARLSEVPNIRAIKNPTSDALTAAHELPALRAKVADGFSIGYSGDWNATEAMIAGGTTWYSVAGGLFPSECLRIVRAIQNGQADEARMLDARLQPLWKLFMEHGSLRVVYAAVNLLGLSQKQPPRPILPLSSTVQNQVLDVLRTLDLN
ncbi:dihydrodipicolinate synthase family protein [Microvirga solisilvae]|uniref:dihydrodipicolinate synthase family protein n=1 Tax=Microvirga solisilvae TaxID=2919498 RepID=UPI001FB0301E|nr:dihydrodipicolinate synthase family protein [Microvirga solisilvae]